MKDLEASGLPYTVELVAQHSVVLDEWINLMNQENAGDPRVALSRRYRQVWKELLKLEDKLGMNPLARAKRARSGRRPFRSSADVTVVEP